MTEKNINDLADKFKSIISEQKMMLRIERNRRLMLSDWTQGADIPDSIKVPYATYRQQLRDLPSVTTFPIKGYGPSLESVDWPTLPQL